MALLKVSDLHVSYGMIKAVRGISFEINEGEIVSLIGANGAGKSTTLNTLAGLLKPQSGEILFEETSLVGMPAPVSYTHLTLPTKLEWCRSRWSPYH